MTLSLLSWQDVLLNGSFTNASMLVLWPMMSVATLRRAFGVDWQKRLVHLS